MNTKRYALIVPSIGIAAVPLFIIPTVERIAVAPDGNHSILDTTTILLGLSALVALLIFIAAVFGLTSQETRPTATLIMTWSAAYVVALGIGGAVGQCVRINAFYKLAERSRPLVSAIRAYESKYGHPPESLQILVPEFLSKVPTTGIGAYPKYRYTTNDSAYHNPWILGVPTPSGLLSFDQFIYFPLTNYPVKIGNAKYLTRIGDWAATHDQVVSLGYEDPEPQK